MKGKAHPTNGQPRDHHHIPVVYLEHPRRESGALRVAITPLQPRVAFVAVCIAIAAHNALGSLAIGEPLTVAFCIDIKISASLNQLLTSGRSFREIQTLEFARTIARFVKPDLYVL